MVENRVRVRLIRKRARRRIRRSGRW